MSYICHAATVHVDLAVSSMHKRKAVNFDDLMAVHTHLHGWSTMIYAHLLARAQSCAGLGEHVSHSHGARHERHRQRSLPVAVGGVQFSPCLDERLRARCEIVARHAVQGRAPVRVDRVDAPARVHDERGASLPSA